MEMVGNIKSNLAYGGEGSRPPLGAPDSEWRQFIIDKYEKQSFVGSDICPPDRDMVTTEAVVSRPNCDVTVPENDLILFDSEQDATKKHTPSEVDFFSSYGL